MQDKLKYYLEIADNAFILSHRLSECCSKGPFLEEDLALTNVALDLIGLAESVYNEAAALEEKNITGDDLAYRREEHEYYNCLLVEQPNKDFAHIMCRQFFMDVFNYLFFTELSQSSDPFLSAVGVKTLKEVTYHLKRSSEWMIRFGRGTDESWERANNAIKDLWKYTPELFEPSNADVQLRGANISVDLSKVKENWTEKINEVFTLAGLKTPNHSLSIKGGKNGFHSEQFGYVLTDIQFLTNKYPSAKW